MPHLAVPGDLVSTAGSRCLRPGGRGRTVHTGSGPVCSDRSRILRACGRGGAVVHRGCSAVVRFLQLSAVLHG